MSSCSNPSCCYAVSYTHLTGTGGWAYFSATRYILGMKPQFDHFDIDPCVPADWKKFYMTREWRLSLIHISYTLGSWQWESAEMFEKSILVPMDGSTTADMSGDTYVYYADGGWSWTVPYIAGVYALCAGVDPDITPEAFYDAAVKTATVITRSKEEGGKEYTLSLIHI